MISSEIFQVLIIIGNILGWLIIYRLIDRKVDRKIMKYWRKIKASEEGQDLFTLVKDVKNLIKSEEAKSLFKEANEVLAEFRAVLKRFKES
ncbi:unnamed protein product, partial [marine sediment metagenome]